MPLSPSAECEELRTVVRRFLEAKSGDDDVRARLDDERGYDPAVWQQLADQIGVPGLAIPEEYGGGGFGLNELAVVAEEAGRALLCAPLLSTAVLATQALLACGDEPVRKDLLPGIADGSVIATLAWLPDSGRAGSASTVTATESTDGWSLDGSTSFVIDGQIADVVLVVASTSSGRSLFAVDGDAAGLTRSALATLDLTRRQSRIGFSTVPARLVGSTGTAEELLDTVLLRTTAVLTAEQVGGAGRALEMAVEYAKVRHQFGRAIGSFQAVKHSCADMYVAVESARAASLAALAAIDGPPADAAMAVSIAKSYCSEAFSFVAAQNIQVHGGIGFTWEHPAHLFFRRAKSSELLFGTPADHREQLAVRVGL